MCLEVVGCGLFVDFCFVECWVVDDIVCVVGMDCCFCGLGGFGIGCDDMVYGWCVVMIVCVYVVMFCCCDYVWCDIEWGEDDICW